MRARRGALLAALAVILVARIASAQPDADENEARQRALRHFERASALAAASLWDDAVRELEAARDIRATPAVHYNLGIALDHLGRRWEAAIAFAGCVRAAGPEDAALRARADSERLRLELALGRIRLVPAPPGARVRVDGRDRAPEEGVVLVDPGHRVVEVTVPGFRPIRAPLDVAAGRIAVVTVDLARLEAQGRLAVAVTPRGSIVSVDGRRRGPSPLELRLRPGRHIVVTRAPGGAERTTRVQLRAGESRRLTFALEESPGLFGRPATWIVAGAVVAGALVVAAVLLLPSGDDGRFQGALGHVDGALTLAP